MLKFTSDLRTISLNSSILISSSWSSDVLLPSEAYKDKGNTYKLNSAVRGATGNVFKFWLVLHDF